MDKANSLKTLRRISSKLSGASQIEISLLLQIPISADMVGVGVRIDDRLQVPSVRVQYFTDLSARVLIVPAIDQINVFIIGRVNAYFGGAVYIPAFFPHLNQFKHTFALFPLLYSWSHSAHVDGSNLRVCSLFIDCLSRFSPRPGPNCVCV